MFHTPPADDSKDWLQSESTKNSYINEPLKPNQLSKNTISIDPLKIKEIEIDVNNISKLPFQLTLPIDEFVTFLKKPRYSKPLKPYQISKLFQKFYITYYSKLTSYLTDFESSDKSESIELNDLINSDELLLLNFKTNLRIRYFLKLSDSILFNHIYDNDNLKLYHKLFKIDSEDVIIQDKFNEKMKLIQFLKISLDYFLDDSDTKILELYNSISDSQFSDIVLDLNTINDVITPVEKLDLFLTATKKLIQLLVITNSKSNPSNKEILINNDYLLPILIFITINFNIKNLYLNLIFIKRFLNNSDISNSSIFILRPIKNELELSNLLDNYNNKSELLFTLTNYDAIVTFLLNITLKDLNFVPNEVQNSKLNDNDTDLLNNPIKVLEIEEAEEPSQSQTHTKSKNRSRSSSTNSLNQSQIKSFYNLPTDLADQSIKTFGLAFDSSLKNMFGRFPFKNSSEQDPQITTTSIPNSVNTVPNITPHESPNLNDVGQLPSVTDLSSSSSQDDHTVASNTTTQLNSPFNKIASGMNEVMKSFRPSLSSTSLSQDLENPSNQSTKRNNRSRSSSLQILDKFYIGKPNLSRNLSHQLEVNNSNASIISHHKIGSDNEIKSITSINENDVDDNHETNKSSAGASIDEKIMGTAKEVEKNGNVNDQGDLNKHFKFHNRDFESLTVTELRDLVKSYNSIIDHIIS